MINEKELRRQLKEKQLELDKLQQELDSAKYQKIIDAFRDGILASDKLIPLIKKKNLNAEDARLLGDSIGSNIDALYASVSDAIAKKQAARARKNEQRKARGRRVHPATAGTPEAAVMPVQTADLTASKTATPEGAPATATKGQPTDLDPGKSVKTEGARATFPAGQRKDLAQSKSAYADATASTVPQVQRKDLVKPKSLAAEGASAAFPQEQSNGRVRQY